jgi:hypothetical protein
VEEISKELSEILKNIRGFKNHRLQGRILFVNKGICREQLPHRDYKPLPSHAITDLVNPKESDSIHSEWVEDHTTSGTRSSTRRSLKTARFSPGETVSGNKKQKISRKNT